MIPVDRYLLLGRRLYCRIPVRRWQHACLNDMTIFQTDKWSSHFVKRNTFQNQLCDSESGSLVRLYWQCSKSNTYHWYAFDSLTYRLKLDCHHTTHRMYNRWFCVWVTQMLLYSEIQLKLIWKLWKELHADLSVALESSQHGLNSHSKAALPICKLSYGMIFCPRLRTSQPIINMYHNY